MTRVLLVGKGAPDRGGIPTFLQGLLEGDLGRRHEITFLNVAHSGTPQGGRATWGNVRRTLHDAFDVWRSARHHDLVHINSALAPAPTALRAGLLAAAGRARGCRVVVHAHGGNVETWLSRSPARAVLRAAMSPVDRVIAVWSAGYACLQGTLGPTRVRLVHNGVDTHHFTAEDAQHDPPRVLYVGLLTPRKGVLDLIFASRMLEAEGLHHELWLLGGTPDEGPAAAVPVLEAAHGSARLLGTRAPADMPSAYAEGSVFCLPSWWEAMPLSVLEAMAAGLPVVATDVGEVRHLVADGVTGYVVPPRSPDQLASALRKLITHPDAAREMGAAGRERAVCSFSASATARAIDAIYEEVSR